MTLQAERLDDLTWADLVDLARRGIAPRSEGQWSLHAPVDPGVTMLELFAYLLEQRVYWLDQLPAAFARAGLELLGVRARGTSSARTVLAIDASAGATAVATGTVMVLAGTQPPLAFSTEDPITALDVRPRVHVITADGDRSEDLRNGRRVQLLPADGGPGELRIGLRMATPPLAIDGHPLSIAIELDADALGVASEWKHEAVDVAAPARLEMFHRTAVGEARWPAPAIDGTGGLRRSGLLRLPIPTDWAPEPGSADADGSRRWDIVIRCASTTFTAPPRAHAVWVNAVIASHRRRACVLQRLLPRPLPGNEIALARDLDPPIVASIAVHLREKAAPDVWQPWTVVADFGRSGPADRVVIAHRDERRLGFGDGLAARLPVYAANDPTPGAPVPDDFASDCPVPVGPDVPNVRVVYDAGGGVRGNVGAGGMWIEQDVGMPRRATNVVDATGGAEPETIEQARNRAAAELRAVGRAVTADDHVALAITTPGVAIARAYAAIGFDPDHPCFAVPGTVSVFVVPRAPRGALARGPDPVHVAHPMPDAAAIAAVAMWLDRHRLAGSVIHVLPPRYRDVSVAIDLAGDPLDPEATRRRVVAALERFFDPLDGGDDGTGWGFGQPVRPSAVARIADAAAAGDARVRAVALGLDDVAATDECREQAIESYELPRLARLDVRVARLDDRGGVA